MAPLPSASVLPVPSTAHQLLMRCQALLIQLLHNGWRYQEQSAISQAELLANDLSAVGFYRLAHVLGQFRNTESEARVEAMNNGVLLCEQLFPCFSNKDEIVLFTKSSTPVPDCSRHGIRHILYSPW